METLIGYLMIVGGVLAFATFYKPHMREPGTPSQRCRVKRRNFYQPVKSVNNRTKGGSSHG
jgi:hypothetical protein